MIEYIRYTAKTMAGMEKNLAEELVEIGAKNIEIATRAVHFEGDKELLYKANYTLRTALRIYVPIAKFKAFDKFRLYKKSKVVEWDQYIGREQTFAIDHAVHSTYFKHSKYASLVIKDAVADFFREKYGERPNVDIKDPDIRLHLYIDKQFVELSVDSSGASLHKRGLRKASVEAPINEVLAAGMIDLIEWDGDSDFLDPMCGSGTILMEAAMKSMHIPPQYFRKEFGFMNWSDYDPELFEKVKKEADAKIKKSKHKIVGFEIDDEAYESASENIDQEFLRDIITLKKGDFFDEKPQIKEGIILMNPPYGTRLKDEDIIDFYKRIGDTFKTHYQGSEAWVLSSNIDALKRVGLRAHRRIALMNGALECKLMGFRLYAGTKKVKEPNE